MPQTITPAPKLAAFLAALPLADAQAFVSPPGLGGTWRSRFIRSGLDKGVLVIHWSGAGLCVVQPATHGVCRECASQKGNDCQHCACSMCAWFRMTEERASPRITPSQMTQLAERLKTFRLGGEPKPVVVGMLDDDLWSD